MDDYDLVLVLIPLGVFGLIALWLVGIVPTWMVIQGNWTAFPWWFSTSIQLSRILGGLICPLYILVALTGRVSFLTKGINMGILALWGYPVYKKALLSLAYTELGGLELQRAILTVIIILALEISIFSGETNKNED